MGDLCRVKGLWQILRLLALIAMEYLDALAEHFAEIIREEGGADAHSLLGASHRVEGIDGYAVVHQGTGELKVVHAGILHGEIETVGEGSAHVVVIHEIETVGEEHVLHVLRPPAVFLHIVEEVVGSAACCLHKCRHGVLHTVGGAAGEGVHQAVGKEIAKLSYSEVLLQRRKDTVIELVAYATHSDALTGIRECLRA